MKWAYTVARFNLVGGILENTLNHYGKEGWELVAIQPQPPHLNLVFKRQAK